MKFGFRTPSLKKRISARVSWKRVVRHRMGLKMPRGTALLTNPKKAIYNKIYHKTTIGVDDLFKKGSQNNTFTSNDIWNTGNFKSREAMLKRAIDKDISTNGKYICPRCNSDLWAIVPISLFFIKGKGVFCETCAKPGDIDTFNKLRH